MGILSSVFFPDHDKCKRLGYTNERFCVSGVDVVMCFVIILELIPEVALVRVPGVQMNGIHTPHQHTHTHATYTHAHHLHSLVLVAVSPFSSHLPKAFWYRRGELEPKFRTLIYYNAVVTILLCLVANFYFFQLGQKGFPTTITPTTTTGTATT